MLDFALLINTVLGLLHLVGTYDTPYKHFTTQVTIQIPYLNNCSVQGELWKLILCFEIYTQMTIQASFKGYCSFYINFDN